METVVESSSCSSRRSSPSVALRSPSSPKRGWLAEKGFDPVYGARPLARVIQTEVRDRLTDEILFDALEGGGTVTIGLKDGKLDSGTGLGAAESARYRVTRHHVMAEKGECDSGQGRRSPLVGKSRCDGERAGRVPPRVEADLRRTPGRRKGRAGSGVHRQVSAGRERVRGSAASAPARDLERRRAHAAEVLTGCSRSSTISIARSTQRGDRRLRRRCFRASRWCSGSF